MVSPAPGVAEIVTSPVPQRELPVPAGAAGNGLTVTVVFAEVPAQPFCVTVTANTPDALTVIDCVTAPVLQLLPDTALDVSTTDPPAQNVVGPFAEIVTTGIVFGAAVTRVSALGQPFTTCLAPYEPAAFTV
jgi:hypothetical protein